MASDTDILFSWRAPASDLLQRLIIAWVAAISIHGLCFYIFQVQDPQASRSLPRTYEITYLSPQDATARLILRQIDDYYAAYEGTLLADSDLNMPLSSRDYEPWHQEVKPRLMPLPEPGQDLNSLGPEGGSVVPPRVRPWAPAVGALTVFSGSIVAVDLGGGCQLMVPEGWQERFQGSPGVDWARVKESQVEDEGRFRWRLSVEASGRVDQAFPVTRLPDSSMRKAARSLRFTPLAEGDPQWVEVELRW